MWGGAFSLAVAGAACVPGDATSPWCVRPVFLDGSVPRGGMVEVLLEGGRAGTWGGGAAWESLGSWPAEAWEGDGVLEVPVPVGREVAALRWEVVHATGGWGETYEVRRPVGGWGATCALPTPVACRFRARRPGQGGGEDVGWQIVPWLGEPSISLAADWDAETSAFLEALPPTEPAGGGAGEDPMAEVREWIRPEEFPGFSRTWGVFSRTTGGTLQFWDTVALRPNGAPFSVACEIIIG